MGSVSIWHWIVVLAIIVMLSSIIVSPIIWFITKNPNNKWLKFFYWVRFSFGVIVIIMIIKDFAFGVLDLHSGFGIGVFVSRSLMAWLLMRRWVKAVVADESTETMQQVEQVNLSNNK
jgi:hypothetical protein